MEMRVKNTYLCAEEGERRERLLALHRACVNVLRLRRLERSEEQ